MKFRNVCSAFAGESVSRPAAARSPDAQLARNARAVRTASGSADRGPSSPGRNGPKPTAQPAAPATSAPATVTAGQRRRPLLL
ncbi:hypothetical protein [Streptomyces sp. NPDC051921]|uniref:hypothetical protein n=1 Tax=Streptomyces sp. NPDC051921 TaxID=3155806 RepID=UPI003423350B